MDYYNRKGELVELASSDYSDGYDIDEYGIYTDGNVFYVLSASGCSCWDGDFDEVEFADFDGVKNYLLKEDSHNYYISLNRASELVKEAESKLGYA